VDTMAVLRGVLVAFLAFTSAVLSLDLASPEVFDAIFYIQSNVEVLQAGIHDVTSAKTHWLQHGIHMGLQGSGDFHTKQYFARYPELRTQLNNDYEQAVRHYLTHGLSEHRLGYVDGGFEGRWTVSDAKHRLFLSTSNRMGGAVDSLVWNHREFINSWDHGRQLQMAVFPAFWLLPGMTLKHGNAVNCHDGSPALNTQPAYHHDFSKTVTLQCPGVDTPCLLINMSFTIASDIPQYHMAQIVAPSTHLTAGFTRVRSVDPDTGHLVTHSDHKPTIVSTTNDHYALGAFCPPGQDPDPFVYSIRNVVSRNAPQATTKLNVGHHRPTFRPTNREHVVNYHTYMCVGTVQDVAECMRILMKPFHQGLIG
ncbi:hypothetical protein BaRGS_00034902, partial [Batillaria attramentaria]